MTKDERDVIDVLKAKAEEAFDEEVGQSMAVYDYLLKTVREHKAQGITTLIVPQLKRWQA